MISTKTFKTSSRAALAALIIGAASVSAMPAQAANPNFSFGFNTGNGLTFYFGDGQQHRGLNKHRRQQVCMTNRQIRRDLRDSGFRQIRFGKAQNGKVRVFAIRGRWEYKLNVNRCSGRVATLDRTRIRPVRHHGNNGVSLQFNIR
jgi:hypothetical protein